MADRIDVSLEPATVADAAALVAVQVAAFHSDATTHPGVAMGGPPGYDDVDQMRRKIENHSVYVIRTAGRVVGGLVVVDVADPATWHLDLLFVDPELHGGGVGSQAMAFLDRTFAPRRWTLHTPEWAARNRHFYEKFGFMAVGETTHPDVTLVEYERPAGYRPSVSR